MSESSGNELIERMATRRNMKRKEGKMKNYDFDDDKIANHVSLFLAKAMKPLKKQLKNRMA